MSTENTEPIISEAIESAERAELVQQRREPDQKLVLGHRWKLVCDLENKAATLFVDIGTWWREKRAFYTHPDQQYSYAIVGRGKTSVTYELDIQSRIIESYERAKEKPEKPVGEVELYDDIIIEAHFIWSQIVDHKQIAAEHPSMRFGTLQSGPDVQFMTDWKSPSFRNEWSNAFKIRPGTGVTLRNTGIWLFEEKPILSYSLFEYKASSSKPSPIGLENDGPRQRAQTRFEFQLAPAKLTLAPPSHLNLKTFIVDPNYGEGD